MSHPARSRSNPLVLSLGADPHVRRLVAEGLGSTSCEIVERTHARDAREFTDSPDVDLVLLDAALQDAHALLRALTASSRVPVLVLTDGDGVERALEAGASDCLVTPLHAALLRARVEFALRCSRAEREIARMADSRAPTSDPYGLPTPVAFLSRVDAAIAAARPEKGQTAVLTVGVDLASLGDVGATAREHVLRITIQRLRDCLRSRDAVGRAATEEPGTRLTMVSEGQLAVVLDGVERPQDAYKIAQRLQQSLAQPIDVDGRPATLPTSFGIALHPEDGARAVELVESAGRALVQAREDAKCAVRFARPEMNSVIFERLALEAHLRHALEREELMVYYQPRISIATGAVVSVEALLRWRHPELGMVSPGQFIPVAEESGLILPIGEWVLREACRQNKAWRDAGLPPISVSVNLSPAQFREPDLIGLVRRALDEAGLASDALELELTESMLLQKGDTTVKTLAGLKAMGVHLSIDDFGTGYSSLNYIKRFPVDALKIDQSFIRDVMTSEQDSALTTSIVLMGKGLNLTVVAEGVETRSQLGLLRALGCDQAQGFLFSRPVPPDEVVRHIRAGFASFVAA